jgi:hypothetical protein
MTLISRFVTTIVQCSIKEIEMDIGTTIGLFFLGNLIVASLLVATGVIKGHPSEKITTLVKKAMMWPVLLYRNSKR